jgi:ankyrin repeat protein
VVLALLEKGADVNANDMFGDTPLHNANMYGKAEVATMLQANGGTM